MNHLSLFSGYEGFGLGLKLTGLPIKTVGYCEKEKYCQEIIKQRIRDGFLDDAPIWPDVRDFPGHLFAGCVDVVTAGFPCQPHSTAGKRRGKDDDRNLWPDTLRIISDVEPRWVLLENVPGILTNGFGGAVVGQLSEIGYDCRWGIVSAADVGANHRRERWWVLAYPHSNNLRFGNWKPKEHPAERGIDALGHSPGLRGEVPYPPSVGLEKQKLQQGLYSREHQVSVANAKSSGLEGGWASGLREARSGLANCGSDVAQPNGFRLEESGDTRIPERQAGAITDSSWWAVEPGLGRVANGVAHRVDRLRAIGGGIVPEVVAEFLSVLEE